MEAIAITYGRTHNNEIATFFVETVEEAKSLAADFITVIPDDLESYQADIDAWTGDSPLVFTHQDDDTFYFNATKVGIYIEPEGEGLDEFSQFVAAFAFEDEDSDE